MIDDIILTIDESSNLVLVLITKQMFSSNLLESIGSTLKIKVAIANNHVKILIPAYHGNGAIEVVKHISDNDNWLNIKDAISWTVGYYQDGRGILLVPVRPLMVDE